MVEKEPKKKNVEYSWNQYRQRRPGKEIFKRKKSQDNWLPSQTEKIEKVEIKKKIR